MSRFSLLIVLLAVQALLVLGQSESHSAHLEHLQDELHALQARQAEMLKSAPDFSFVATDSSASATAAVDGTATLASGEMLQQGANHVKLKKLKAAMTAVKEDIMNKLREAQRESQWVKEVEGIVIQYKKKVKNVKKNLTKLRQDIKALIQKKRQIRNAQIQEKLYDRLQDANGDLKLVKDKLTAINAQHKAFDDNRKKIANTIAKINAELKHLRGEKEQPKKKPAPAAKKDDKAKKEEEEKKKKAAEAEKK